MVNFFRTTSDGISLSVRLTPKSSRDAIEAVKQTADGHAHLQVRVRAVPEDGRANQALKKLLAMALRVPARDVTVVSGATSRLKTLSIRGDPARLGQAALALASARS